MEDVLILSSGRGPVEVRRFVAALAAHLCALGGRELSRHGDPPDSVQIALTDGVRFVGTHVLVSALRGRGARKRWFARVDLAPKAGEATPFDPRDVALQATRAGGPGGQNVNKRSTAVRAVHAPTQISVRASGERSQERNRAAALRRLEAVLRERDTEDASRQRAAVRGLHEGLERGNARFEWRLNDADGLEPLEKRR